MLSRLHVPRLRAALEHPELFDGPYAARCYYQDFTRNADGTYELPRLSSGYSPKKLEMWQDISGMNYLGVFSHFVHPDEIFFKETGDKGWGELSAGFSQYMAELRARYGWLRALTASEGAAALGDLLDMDYRVERRPWRCCSSGNRGCCRSRVACWP